MAKVLGPLLSLSASGKFAETMTFAKWKGIPVVRQFVTPANPQTAAQVAHRNLFKAAVEAWKNYFTNADMRAGWNRLAGLLAKPQSGFNAFTGSATKVGEEDPDASFVSDAPTPTTTAITVSMLNIDDGAAGDEAGSFIIQTGTTPENIADNGTASIAAGDVAFTFTTPLAAATTHYFKVVKDMVQGRTDRSGIWSGDTP